MAVNSRRKIASYQAKKNAQIISSHLLIPFEKNRIHLTCSFSFYVESEQESRTLIQYIYKPIVSFSQPLNCNKMLTFRSHQNQIIKRESTLIELCPFFHVLIIFLGVFIIYNYYLSIRSMASFFPTSLRA